MQCPQLGAGQEVCKAIGHVDSEPEQVMQPVCGLLHQRHVCTGESSSRRTELQSQRYTDG